MFYVAFSLLLCDTEKNQALSLQNAADILAELCVLVSLKFT